MSEPVGSGEGFNQDSVNAACAQHPSIAGKPSDRFDGPLAEEHDFACEFDEVDEMGVRSVSDRVMTCLKLNGLDLVAQPSSYVIAGALATGPTPERFRSAARIVLHH